MTDDPRIHPHQPAIGLSHAVDLANRAINDIPAYPQFLDVSAADVSTVTEESFKKLTPMTKENYLIPYEHRELVWGGDIGKVVNWSASSGSTGEPTYFPRSRVSLYDSIRFHERILRDSFDADQKTTLVINTFAMGNWVGGTYTLIAINGTNDLDLPVGIISPGMKTDEAVRAFIELGRAYQQVVIAGYPPFVKGVIDAIAPDELLRRDVRVLLAGESITERWRTAILEKIGKLHDPRAITLIYGTADAGMMGFESPASIAIRRAADADSALATLLFGPDLVQLPTFASYDPLSRYAETDSDGFLLFTIESTLPLLRYRIKDYGMLYDAAAVAGILTSVGHFDLAAAVPDTAHFLTVSGRAGVELTLNGLNLYQANFKAALEDKRVIDRVTTIYYVPQAEQKDLSQKFEIEVELGKDVEPSEKLRKLLTDVFVEKLCELNGEYRTQYQSDPISSTPHVKLADYEARVESNVKHQPFARTR